MQRLQGLVLGMLLISVLPADVEAACKVYSLTASKKSVQVTAPLISNKGPGTVVVSPPGVRMPPHDLFMGNSNYRYRVTLVGGSKASVEACN